MPIEDEKLALEKQKFAWEKAREKKGYSFKNYIIPVSSIFITIAVTVVAFLSYHSQTVSQDAQMALEKEKFKLDFVDKQRESARETRKDFDAFIEKVKPALESKHMRDRRLITNSLLTRYVATAPDLLIDYFRAFREEAAQPDSKIGEECADDLDKCLDDTPEYQKRAGLMNYVRTKANNKVTVYVFCTDADKLATATQTLRGEGFTVGDSNDGQYIRLEQDLGYHTPYEVRFFYEQDETFAQNIVDRLSEAMKQSAYKTDFHKVFVAEADFRSLRTIAVMIDLPLKSKE